MSVNHPSKFCMAQSLPSRGTGAVRFVVTASQLVVRRHGRVDAARVLVVVERARHAIRRPAAWRALVRLCGAMGGDVCEEERTELELVALDMVE